MPHRTTAPRLLPAPTAIMAAILGLVLALAACATPAATARSSDVLACQRGAERRLSPRAALSRCTAAIADRRETATARLASLINRAIVAMHLGDLRAAEADLDAAIRAAPESSEAWLNKGLLLLRRQGAEQEAVALLTHAIELGPARPARAYYARAMANETAGRLRDAYDDYGRAAALDPGWDEPGEQLKRFKVVRKKTMQG